MSAMSAIFLACILVWFIFDRFKEKTKKQEVITALRDELRAQWPLHAANVTDGTAALVYATILKNRKEINRITEMENSFAKRADAKVPDSSMSAETYAHCLNLRKAQCVLFDQIIPALPAKLAMELASLPMTHRIDILGGIFAKVAAIVA